MAVRPEGTASSSDRENAHHILVVDDDEPFRTLMSFVLERAGFQVTRCADAFIALDYLCVKPHLYSLLVTDHAMPGRTGLELVQELKTVNSALPVILASAHITNDMVSAAERLGVKAVLPKEDVVKKLAPLVTQMLRTNLKAALL